MTPAEPILTVGDVAARSGVAVSALHYYEREGLIASERTAGNQRRYRRDVLRRVAFIRVSQRVGVPLADIRAALDSLPAGRTPTKKDWARLSRLWRAELDGMRAYRCLFNLCAHPFLSGRPGRAMALRHLIEYARECADVTFARCRDVAAAAVADPEVRVRPHERPKVDPEVHPD